MKKGTSKLPLVMGVIGGILAIPLAVCSGACAAGLTATTEAIDSTTARNIIMGLGIIGGLLGIIGGILSKPLPIPSGILLSIGVVFLAVSSIPNIVLQVKMAPALDAVGSVTNVVGGIQRIVVVINILQIICVILLLLGALISFTQKKEELSAKVTTG